MVPSEQTSYEVVREIEKLNTSVNAMAWAVFITIVLMLVSNAIYLFFIFKIVTE